MSKPLVRLSTFRHVFGTPFQFRDTYGDIRPGGLHTESTVLKANAKFLAVPWEKIGSVCIIPIERVGTVAEETPLIFNGDEFGDPTQLNEFNFSPVDDHLIATAGNDGHLSVFRIPEGGLTESLTQPDVKVKASDKRLLSLEWHPTSSGLVFVASAGKEVKFFDVEAGGSEVLSLPDVHGGLLTSFSWNAFGNQLVTSSKDKTLRIFDPRGNEVVAEVAKDHDGAQSIHNIWMYVSDKIVTAGFTRTRDRELHVWDPRNLNKSVGTEKFDGGASALFLFQDEDLGLLYAGGKGDSTLKYYELDNTDKCIHLLNEYVAKTPQNGLALLPKALVDVKACEIARFVKLSGNRIEPIRFEVPRHASVASRFQEDIFPDTWDRQPILNAADWLGGEDGIRGRVSLSF